MKTDPIKFIKGNAESLTVFLNLIPLPMFIKDFNGQYLACNQAFEKTSGLRAEDIVGKDAFEIWSVEQAEIFDAKDKALYASPDMQDFETEVNTPSGTRHIVQFHKKVFYDASGNPAGYVCILFDNTEKKTLENKLMTQALTDELTQLANRRAGMARVQEILSESKRKKEVLCLAILDIDHFKKINDTYGHLVGDAVLALIGNVLKATLREYDLCARLGGEEFMICLPSTKVSDARDVLERVRLACESAVTQTQDQQQVKVSASIGFATFPTQGKTIEALLEASDKALYFAKEAGRNQVVYLGAN